MNNTGRKLFVTGASSDMGMCLIDSCGKEYESVYAQYRTMSDGLQNLKHSLEDKLVLLQCDFSSYEDTKRLVTNMVEQGFIPNHIVHFPAPKCKNQYFHKIKWETFEHEINISLRSLDVILSTFLPYMKKERYGRVIAIISNVVNNAPPANISNYVTIKYALLGLIKALAREYSSYGITVNGVSPAWVDTKFISEQPRWLMDSFIEKSPTGRYLTSIDIIPTIEYLLSDTAACINGQNATIT